MDFKPMLMLKLKDFVSEFPEYSFGEIMYSIFANSNVKQNINKSDFLKIKDESFYSMIERAIKNERDD